MLVTKALACNSTLLYVLGNKPPAQTPVTLPLGLNLNPATVLCAVQLDSSAAALLPKLNRDELSSSHGPRRTSQQKRPGSQQAGMLTGGATSAAKHADKAVAAASGEKRSSSPENGNRGKQLLELLSCHPPVQICMAGWSTGCLNAGFSHAVQQLLDRRINGMARSVLGLCC